MHQKIKQKTSVCLHSVFQVHSFTTWVVWLIIFFRSINSITHSHLQLNWSHLPWLRYPHRCLSRLTTINYVRSLLSYVTAKKTTWQTCTSNMPLSTQVWLQWPATAVNLKTACSTSHCSWQHTSSQTKTLPYLWGKQQGCLAPRPYQFDPACTPDVTKGYKNLLRDSYELQESWQLHPMHSTGKKWPPHMLSIVDLFWFS